MMRMLAAKGGYQAFHLGGVDKTWLYICLVAGIVGIAAGLLLARNVLSFDQGTAKMKEIALAVQEGAQAFLARQFRAIVMIIVPLDILIFFTATKVVKPDGGIALSFAQAGLYRVICFLFGAAFFGLTGFIGMSIAVRGNVRTAASASKGGGMAGALRVAFRTGAVTGMLCVGLGLLGATAIVLIFQNSATAVLIGFAFGASLLALFMRVGGGIFTKAADVGADLVGKVEAGIPEDDPRNAATIADNVGDNVGDCAGMAADLFESYAVTLVAALILGQTAFGSKGLLLPLIIGGIGIISSVVGILTTNLRASDRNGLVPINRGFFISASVSIILVVIASFVFLPGSFGKLNGTDPGTGDPRWIAVGAVAIGIVLAVLIQQLTGYFTDTIRRPVKDVAASSQTGPATVILAGISLGLESAVYSAILIGAAVFGAFLLGGGAVYVALYAVALAGCGLLTTAGVIVSMDTFGPVSDNAQGIAEMSGDIDEVGARVLTDLDAVGNTTKAITKGIAIATAVLAATALFGSFNKAFGDAVTQAGLSAFDSA